MSKLQSKMMQHTKNQENVTQRPTLRWQRLQSVNYNCIQDDEKKGKKWNEHSPTPVGQYLKIYHV